MALILILTFDLSYAYDCQDDIAKTKIEVQRFDGDIEHKGEPDLYFGGLKLSISIFKSNPNSQELITDILRLNSHFYPGKRQEYSQQRLGDYIFGAGPPTNREFYVNLQGLDIDPAIWTNGNSSVKAKSLNLLDTPDSNFNAFIIKGTNAAVIKGTVLAHKSGLYDITLLIGYGEGSKRGECLFNMIRIYQDEDDK